MTLVSKIVAALHALRRRSKTRASTETYVFDRRKGFVELRTDPHVAIRMELFKRFVNKKSWGFELTARNRSEETVEELLIVFNKKFTVIFDKIRPDSMKIKSLEFTHEEFDTDEFSVEISIVLTAGKKAISEAYSLTIPMSSIITDLKEAGKITPIEVEDEDYKPSGKEMAIEESFVAESMKQASIKPRVAMVSSSSANTRDQLQEKLRELDGQKAEITKSFMKREIDYSTFTQLVNPIVQEIILIKAHLSKQQKE